jgi:hypothetical protein
MKNVLIQYKLGLLDVHEYFFIIIFNWSKILSGKKI